MALERQAWWNVNEKTALYLLTAVALTVFAFGIFRRFKTWSMGRSVDRTDDMPKRIKPMARYIFGNKEILRGLFPRVLHLSIFYGLLVLATGSFFAALQDAFNIRLLPPQLGFLVGLFLDLAGLAGLVGIALAGYRRFIEKPDRLENTAEDVIILVLLGAILAGGFVLEGLRIYATTAPLAWWSPVGRVTALLFQLAGISEPSALLAHRVLWYSHMFMAMGFIAYIPYSKLFHMVTSPLNYLFRTIGPKGALAAAKDIAVGGPQPSEAGGFQDFTWKQLLDIDACVSCGRCHKNCPAQMSGKPLSPKDMTRELKKHIYQERRGSSGKKMIGDVVSAEALWSCTTCMSCEDRCPMLLEHVSKIVDMRRTLVMQEHLYPAELVPVFNSLESLGNPWGHPPQERSAWAEGLALPTLQDNPNPELVYWVGCAGAFNSRNQQVSRALVRVMQKAGIDFAILGPEEQCCGDAVRRLGNEQLYQQLAQKNIQVLRSHNVRTVLTSCAHCYNTLKNEYPQSGGTFEVLHHAAFLAELIKKGRIKPVKQVVDRVTYHDPCFLGRYNEIYEEPRDVLASIPGLELVEMKHIRRKSLCCGAGGGRSLLPEGEEQKVNRLRIKQAIKTKADVISVACPYCLTELAEVEGRKGKDQRVVTMDLAEIVDMSM